MTNIAALVLSDLHLGSNNCKDALLLNLLKKIGSTTLIINGDLLDSPHLHRLNKTQWKILGTIRKLSKKNKVILVEGNHDCDETLVKLLGIEVHEKFDLEVNNQTFVFIHGHQFEFLFVHLMWLTKIISAAYYFLCKIPFLRKMLNDYLHDENSMLRSEKLKKHALQMKKKEGVKWIACGHSHFAECDWSTGYINSGTFCNSMPTYLSIDIEGRPSIIHVDEL